MLIDTVTLPPRIATLVRLIVRHQRAIGEPQNVKLAIDCGAKITFRVDPDPTYTVNVRLAPGEES